MTVGALDVERWLDANPSWMEAYFLRRVEVSLVNKWLVMHGFSTLQDYISVRRGSLSQELPRRATIINELPQQRRASLAPDIMRRPSAACDSLLQTSPEVRAIDTFFADKDRTSQKNSKKHLRQDFARARLKSVFRTCESPSPSDSALERRRSSLKGMRQFLSLPSSNVSMLSMLLMSKVRLPRYASIDVELKRQMRMCNERDFFLEIVKDISHDLNLRSLTGRILVNISLLLNADRSSLFFVEGPKGKRSLVSKVFDVYTGTDCIPTGSGDNRVRIPWGQGIIGHVAATGDIVNITNASQDPRYNGEVDRTVGYTTDSLLCLPIRNADDEIIGVAQATNKHPDQGALYPQEGFTRDDEKDLEMYLAFCGMAISNAQAIDSYTREYDRNKALLEVVHDLFEEQTSLEDIVRKIMHRARTLLECERCIVMLHDQATAGSEFNRVFDLHESYKNGYISSSFEIEPELLLPKQIAQLVTSSGETVNIADVNSDPRYKNACAGEPGSFHLKSILCKPIRNNHLQTIGVAQVINKSNDTPFDDSDEQLFEAFTIFCGLGINNCMLYDELARSSAKQAVALEVLSYHATIPAEVVTSFKTRHLSDNQIPKLSSLDFNDFSLGSDQMVVAAIAIFKETGLLKTFRIDYETLIRWLLTVRKNYRNVAYHNWRHAFNVCQFMHTLLQTCKLKQHFERAEVLGLIVACLCHDLDHRGTNNAFQTKSSSPLSQLYGTQATLEHHHFNHAVMILNSEGHNIFANMNSEEYTKVMLTMKKAIIATDLSLHMGVRKELTPLVQKSKIDWKDQKQKELLSSMIMTTCDIATCTKPWEVQNRAAKCVVEEFFDQGDKEKTVLKIQPQALMDRDRQHELPRLQIEWIDFICDPLFKLLAGMDEQFKPLLDRVHDNRQHWLELDQERQLCKVVRETDL